MATGQRAEPQDAKLMDPVCGLRVDASTAAASSEYGGRTYYFHAPQCKAVFDADPARFAPAVGERTDGVGTPPARGGAATRSDPVCGMPVPEAPDALEARFDGVTYAFCSEACRRAFLHKPEQFVASITYEPGRHATG